MPTVDLRELGAQERVERLGASVRARQRTRPQAPLALRGAPGTARAGAG